MERRIAGWVGNIVPGGQVDAWIMEKRELGSLALIN
jgi:hypothetical protein